MMISGRQNPLKNKLSRRVTGSLLLALLAGSIPSSSMAQDAPPAGGATAAAAGAEQKIEIATIDGRIETALLQINSQIPNQVSIYGKVPNSRVTVTADGATVDQVLNMIANPNGWVWWREDNGDYGLADKEYYERNILPKRVVQKVFRPNNIKASELDRAIKGLLTPNVGSSVADDRTNKLIVNDLPPALERIERFIREIDVQLIVRVFYVRQANVEDLAKKLEQYKSGPGTIEVDKKTHQIIVTDLLSNIKKMELLVDILDVGPEIVQYDINNIGIDGKDLESLQKIIETIRTKDLLFEVSAKQGVMILEDVPEIHERVEQILAQFDKPARQVLIQSEILSTLFKKTFNFGLERFGLADDLLGASSQGALGSGDILAPGTAAAANPRFTNTQDIFPNLTMSGNTTSGNYLTKSVLIQFKAVYSESSTRVLLQPRLLVKNQQKSNIFVGEEVPFLTTFFNDNNNNAGSTRTETQSTVQSGLKFEITPSISNSYLVEMEIRIDNDAAKETPDPSGRRLIGRDRQNVETTLQIPSGATRMIGGLIQNKDSDGSSGFPFLSSLPIVGALFGVKSSGKDASNLMIFLTPSIVEEELPVMVGSDGRRGKSLTNYDRTPGMILPDEEKEEGDDPTMLPRTSDDQLLSGEYSEEQEMTELLRKRRTDALKAMEDDQAGNYTPSAGFGSTTLNSAGGPAGTPSGGAANTGNVPPGNDRNDGRTIRTVTPQPGLNIGSNPIPPTPAPSVQPGETQYR